MALTLGGQRRPRAVQNRVINTASQRFEHHFQPLAWKLLKSSVNLCQSCWVNRDYLFQGQFAALNGIAQMAVDRVGGQPALDWRRRIARACVPLAITGTATSTETA